MYKERNSTQPAPVSLSFGQTILRIVVICLAYFLAHQLAFLFPDAEQVIMALWPAGGIGLAALLLNPRRLWPAIILSLYLAGVSANVFVAGRSFFAAVGYMTGNMVESLGCAWLILRWSEGKVRFARVSEVLALIAGAIGVNACSACIGAGTAVLSRGASFGSSWLSWYVADGLGVLLLTPLIVSWLEFRDWFSDIRWSRLAEWGAFLVLWYAFGRLSFQPDRAFHALSPHPYTLVALLAWPALRFGQRGVTLALVVLAGIAVTSANAGSSPWGGQSPTDRLLVAQVYLGIAGSVGLLLAATVKETRSVEATLRESENRLRQAATAGKVGLWDWDLRTNQVFYSTEWKRQIGYEDYEITNDFSEWESRVHPEDLDPTHQRVRDLIEGNSPRHEVEFRFRHKDGSYRWILAQASILVDAQGKPQRMLGSHVDITERKRREEEKTLLEAQLRQSQKLEAVGQLANGVAHEFNNLMTVVGGYAELAQQEIPPDHPAHASLRTILEASAQATGVTQSLLAFSRHFEARIERVVPSAVVEEAARMLQRLLPQSIELITEVAQEPHVWTLADSVQLKQVILNLAINARDAMPEGGRLRISCKSGREHVSQGTTGETTAVYIEVADSGTGIAKELVDRIFDPFFTTKSRGQGTGLGLSIVHGIVKTFGGHIEVTSEVGKGSTFTIVLPGHTRLHLP